VVVVVVVVVVVSGASSAPPHAAVNPTIATIAVPPTAAAMRRRVRRFDLMVSPLLSPSSEHVIFGESRTIRHGPWWASGDAFPAVVHQPHPEVGSDDRNLNVLVKRTHNHWPANSRARPELP
jgi:hypothetical protein